MFKMDWKTGLSKTEMRALRSAPTCRLFLKSSVCRTFVCTSLRRSRAARVSLEIGILIAALPRVKIWKICTKVALDETWSLHQSMPSTMFLPLLSLYPAHYCELSAQASVRGCKPKRFTMRLRLLCYDAGQVDLLGLFWRLRQQSSNSQQWSGK